MWMNCVQTLEVGLLELNMETRASPPSSVQTPVSYICLLTKKRLEKDKNPKSKRRKRRSLSRSVSAIGNQQNNIHNKLRIQQETF